MLVATKVIARSTIENKIVLNALASVVPNAVSTHSVFFLDNANENNATAIKPTAIPNVTHKNTGGTVITAVILRKAVIIPITKLITNATPRHSNFLLHILFTPLHIMKIQIKSEKEITKSCFIRHSIQKNKLNLDYLHIYIFIYMCYNHNVSFWILSRRQKL